MRRRNDGIDVEGRQPGFYLYPADLERELSVLPPEAQALWIRMLIRMHFAPRRGYLEHATGQAYGISDIAKLIGISRKKADSYIKAMRETYGTFSVDSNGTIFNRRMVRDTEISMKRKAAGSLGGNPALKNLDNQPPPDSLSKRTDLDNQDPNQIPTLSSSTSTSTSPKGKHTQSARVMAADFDTQSSTRFLDAWQLWPFKQGRDSGCRMWLSLVTSRNEDQVFACLHRFLGSDMVARGVVGYFDRWLDQQNRDHWEGQWPARRGPEIVKTKQQEQADAWKEA